MSDLTERIAALSPKKLSLLSRQLREKGETSAGPQVIGRREATDFCPLSFAQERLWLIEQLEPGNHAYNIPDTVRLTGPLDVEAFHRALNEIVKRHEVLRTTFTIIDEQPAQVIAPSLTLPLDVIDLREFPEDERETQALRRIAQEAQRPFDLSEGPLIRALLLRLGEADNVVLLNMHHIVSDAWSVNIFTQEMTTFYRAFAAGVAVTLPELPIQYADFAVWQREWLQDAALEPGLLYWKKQLDGAPPSLDLNTDRPRPAIQSFNGAHETFRLSSALSESLKALSHQQGATLFMTLLAAFQTLLSRYSGQREIVVGTPISGRNRAELEPLIGFFLNILVIRADMNGDPSFNELLSRVRQTCLEAYTHQDVPFEKLVEELQPQRDLSRSPLFQVMFAFENAAAETAAKPGYLTVRPLKFNNETAKYDLTLALVDDGQDLAGTLEYNTDLFETATAARLINHFEQLLEGIAADPHQRISQLPLLTEAERRQLLNERNDTHAPFPSHLCFHHLFESQVELSPDAIALVFEDQSLSYRELNNRANRLAHHLLALGVARESLVGILLQRSAQMVTALLAVLKCGAAYVPLDPAYPRERLSFMIADANLRLLITDQTLPAEFAVPSSTTLLSLAAEQQSISEQSMLNPETPVSPQNLAYVIY
ncbi:MAG: condensation domain-containing protein, partial [Pyrinomonadaceae bacterium]